MILIQPSFTEKADWHDFGKDGTTPTGLCDIKLVRWILENYHIYIIGRLAYIYEDGVYRVDETETRLKEIIANLILDKLVNINTITRVYNLVISTHSIQRTYDDVNNYCPTWINFKNCMFDVIEWKEIPHAPKYFAINQIPHEFHKDAEYSGTTTKAFVDFAVPDPADRQMLWEYYGYCMTTDSSLQKFMIFKGQGGTGKSQLIKIVEKMVGRINISNVSLEQLSEQFYPATLLGKLLNSCADIPSNALKTVAEIKKITGEDMIIANKKFKDMLSFNSYAKLIFSANEIPVNIDEKSEALYRRMLIVKVEKKPLKKDRNLWDKLESEINYSIMVSCRALQTMYANGHITESQNNIDNVQELYMESDTIKAFLYDKMQVSEGLDIKSSDLFEAYKDYCEESGRQASSAHGFHRNMKNKGFIKKRTGNGEKYFGLAMAENTEFVPAEEYVSSQEVYDPALPFN